MVGVYRFSVEGRELLPVSTPIRPGGALLPFYVPNYGRPLLPLTFGQQRAALCVVVSGLARRKYMHANR